jgi:hypothetical protein
MEAIMKKFSKILLFSILAVFLMAGNALAVSFGSNITIWDKMYWSSAPGTGQGNEDNETEPDTLRDQRWDLEAFFLKGSTLTMVGGYDFQNGYGGWDSGDLFIDVTGDAKWGPDIAGSGGGEKNVANAFGYDFVMDLNFSTMTYEVYAINPGSVVTVYYGQNDESNPWRYASGGTQVDVNGDGIIDSSDTLSIGWWTGASVDGLSNSWYGTYGEYAASVDLGWLYDNPDYNGEFISHFTYECGNDNLMAAVPEPATMLLFGSGLIGLAGLGRKKFFRKS